MVLMIPKDTVKVTMITLMVTTRMVMVVVMTTRIRTMATARISTVVVTLVTIKIRTGEQACHYHWLIQNHRECEHNHHHTTDNSNSHSSSRNTRRLPALLRTPARLAKRLGGEYYPRHSRGSLRAIPMIISSSDSKLLIHIGTVRI